MWSNIKCLYDGSYGCDVCADVKRCKDINVVRLLYDGKSLGEIAEYFGVSMRTIRRASPRGLEIKGV